MIPADVLPRLRMDPDAVHDPFVIDSLLADPIARRYHAFFAAVDWRQVPERSTARVYPGPRPTPRSVAIKALIVKLCEHRSSAEHLRTYLLEHPALTLLLGFRPVVDETTLDGIDWERTVPSARWLRQQQHDRAPDLAAVLALTVRAAQQHAADVGHVVAIDTTHIVAHVRENNPKIGGPLRRRGYQPPGDRDCRLGAKVLSNQSPGRRKTYLYGYGCGIATTPVTVEHTRHDLILATHVLPFNAQDIRYFRPLSQGATDALGHPPTHLTADAAFDAWYVYAAVVDSGGIAAIARNPRSTPPPRSAAGHPLCAQGRPMRPTSVAQHEDGYPVQRYACPLKGPTAPPGATCPLARFYHGGCSKRVNLEIGAQSRTTIDRTDPAFRALYAQRTCVERSNSQAKALGLERPRVRSLAAVTTLAGLTAIAVNLATLVRIRADLTPKQT